MIVAPYGAILGLIFVVLSLRVIQERRAQAVSLGAPPRSRLERKVRVHANFAEYVPFALLLLFLAEGAGAPGIVMHALCTTLLVGRVAHAWGVSPEQEDFRMRVAGIVCTLSVFLIASGFIVFSGIRLP
jgi:uncharacterized membrane protein YecN with MAPEG domain